MDASCLKQAQGEIWCKKTNPLGSDCANLPSVCSKSTTLLTFISILAARIRWVWKHLLIPQAQAKHCQQRKALAKQPNALGKATSRYIKKSSQGSHSHFVLTEPAGKWWKRGTWLSRGGGGDQSFRIKGEQFQVNTRSPCCGRSWRWWCWWHFYGCTVLRISLGRCIPLPAGPLHTNTHIIITTTTIKRILSA